MPKLLIERRAAVTLFTLNRPEVHNNVDHELAVELADAIIAFGADPAAKVLVVTGAGDKSFCAGANLKGMQELFEHRHTHSASPMGFARLDPGKPVIAAVNGHCYAGGRRTGAVVRLPHRRRAREVRVAEQALGRVARRRRHAAAAARGRPRQRSLHDRDRHGARRAARAAHRSGAGGRAGRHRAGSRVGARRAHRRLPAGRHSRRSPALATLGTSLEEGLDLEEELCWPHALTPEAIAGMRRFAEGSRPAPPRPVQAGGDKP